MSRKAVPSRPLSPFAFRLKNSLKSHSTRKSRSVIRPLHLFIPFRRRRTRKPKPQDCTMLKKKKKQSVLILLLLCKKLLLHLLLQKKKSVAFMPQHNDYEKKN